MTNVTCYLCYSIFRTGITGDLVSAGTVLVSPVVNHVQWLMVYDSGQLLDSCNFGKFFGLFYLFFWTQFICNFTRDHTSVADFLFDFPKKANGWKDFVRNNSGLVAIWTPQDTPQVCPCCLYESENIW